LDQPNQEDRPKAKNVLEGADSAAFLSAGGFLFLLVSLAALTAMFYFLATVKVDSLDITSVSDTRTIYAQLISHYLRAYLGPFMMLLVSILASALGFAMIQVSGRATRRVINPDDRAVVTQMLLSNNQAGIDNYIRLSSLTGVIGAFTKLGLSGLPLATIALTVIFALMALITLNSDSTSKAMLDLCKLTLGAFIGSYVQKQTAVTGTGQVPPAQPAGQTSVAGYSSDREKLTPEKND